MHLLVLSLTNIKLHSMSQIPSAAPYLSMEERKMLMQHHDGRAFLELVLLWLVIFGIFFLITTFPKVYIIIPAVLFLGGKQLACAVLMHDCAHFSVFSNKRVNDFIGRWLGGFILFNHMDSYRHYHQQHHVTTGTAEDPDLLLTRGYPTSKKSMIRKFSRDLSGITGVKSFFALVMMALGYLKYTQAGEVKRTPKAERQVNWKWLIGPIVINVVFYLILSFLFEPWIYLIWLLAYFTSFQFCIRVRAMAEHSMVEDSTNPIRNTRTTKANVIERLLFAPYNVNYHVEHHMLMTVPSYNLPKMHKLLMERGFYEKGLLANGYWEIIKQAAKG